MATKNEKIQELLECEHGEVIISPDSAAESEFGATYEGIRLGYFQFVDGDGDYWDCSPEEIDTIELEDGTQINVCDIEDDPMGINNAK